MSESDIFLTLYSIVAGLGLTRLVQGVASLIAARGRLQFNWMHASWLMIIFMAHVVSWFALLRFPADAHWTVFDAIAALSMPIVLYLVSDLIIPRIEEGERVDLREHFLKNCRWFTGLLIAFVLFSMVVQVTVAHHIEYGIGGALRLLALVTIVFGFSSQRPAVQNGTPTSRMSRFSPGRMDATSSRRLKVSWLLPATLQYSYFPSFVMGWS